MSVEWGAWMVPAVFLFSPFWLMTIARFKSRKEALK